MNQFLGSIVSWLRAGYPEGIPPTDTFAVLALLTTRLSHDDIKTVAHEVMRRNNINGTTNLDAVDDVDIAVLITRLTNELPSPDDVERVRQRLVSHGWPLDTASEA